MGTLFSSGINLVFDAALRYTRSDLTCYLRLQNFPSSGDYIEVGMQYTPSGTSQAAASQSGFTDIVIDPPPSTEIMSVHNIGLYGQRFNFGSREFLISNTFVEEMQQQYDITDPYDVFRNWDGTPQVPTTPVIGVIYENKIFTIEEVIPHAVGGHNVSWKLLCNFPEQALQGAAVETSDPAEDVF